MFEIKPYTPNHPSVAEDAKTVTMPANDFEQHVAWEKMIKKHLLRVKQEHPDLEGLDDEIAYIQRVDVEMAAKYGASNVET